MKIFSVFLLALCSSFSAFAQTYDASQMTRQQKISSKSAASFFREAQSRHGSTLQVRLMNLMQEVLSSEPAIESYCNENKSRNGAIVYVCATGGGEAGKTIHLVFYAPPPPIAPLFDTSKFKEIRGWMLPNAIAQQIARDTATRLSSAPEVMSVSSKIGSEYVEVTLTPPNSESTSTPVLAETVSLR